MPRYSTYDLNVAVSLVRRQQMTLAEAARCKGIPYTTLSDHVTGRFYELGAILCHLFIYR